MRLRWAWRSLSLRIAVLQVAAVALAGAFTLLAIHWMIDTTFARFERRVMLDRAQVIAAAVSVTPHGLRLALPAQVAALYRAQSGGIGFAVVDRHGQAIAGSPPLGALPGARLAGDPGQRSGANERYWRENFAASKGTHAFTVALVQDLANPDVNADDIVRSLIGRVALVVVPIVLALLLADLAIVWLALRPVRAATRQLASEHEETSARLAPRAFPTEIEPLIAAINNAFARLDQALRRHREFSADVAHELRTPLAVMRLRAEKLADRTCGGPLIDDIDVMARTIEQMLALTEAQTRRPSHQQLADLAGLAVDVAALLAPAALESGRAIEVVGADRPLWVEGDGDMLVRALRNLVENALRYTPQGTAVRIQLEPPATVAVIDRGPGFTDAEMEKLFERQWRRDRQHAGFGLGLTIVRAIAASCGGTVCASNLPDGGACLTLTLIGAQAP